MDCGIRLVKLVLVVAFVVEIVGRWKRDLGFDESLDDGEMFCYTLEEEVEIWSCSGVTMSGRNRLPF